VKLRRRISIRFGSLDLAATLRQALSTAPHFTALELGLLVPAHDGKFGGVNIACARNSSTTNKRRLSLVRRWIGLYILLTGWTRLRIEQEPPSMDA
jgi:hypothetical protein